MRRCVFFFPLQRATKLRELSKSTPAEWKGTRTLSQTRIRKVRSLGVLGIDSDPARLQLDPQETSEYLDESFNGGLREPETRRRVWDLVRTLRVTDHYCVKRRADYATVQAGERLQDCSDLAGVTAIAVAEIQRDFLYARQPRG